ncbi:MAG: acyl-CoA dehydrogenase [Polyangiaceae bacterium]|nr:acyl-CoA dehydrogenase [Polyangiaceae bacterium]
MSTVHHYRSNLRDISFNLFEFLELDKKTLGKGPYATLDKESAWSSITAFEKLCKTEIAASFAAADRDPPVLEDGVVKLPASLKKSMDAFWEGGWHMFEVPERLGGIGAPPTMVWSVFELLAGSNAAAAFILSGSFWALMIDKLATDAQKKRYLPQMIDKRWGGAMVLTEPDAGSDVGAGRTKARQIEGDVWEIEGTKRFITNGDYEYAENIVHLVLARPEGAAPGTKGLSLFIVPKYWVDENGAMGERNGWVCSKLEKKMGIKASVTCEIVYGGDKPARGLLVGNVHDGIRQMFHVIEQARMAVGMKSMTTLSTAYLNALEYAKERVQGPDLLRATDKTAPRVRIIEHADVRRMLMLLKCHAEGMRALGYFTTSVQDEITLAGGHGATKDLDKLNDLLLPLVKGWCSDKSYELLATALQTYGGSGYCQDYPIEQYVRDQKIDTLYEGTTHIQALDLFFRKVAKDGGATLQGLLGRVKETLEKKEGGEELLGARASLASALGDLEAIYMTMMGKATESLHHVGLQGNRILFATAEVVVGWLLVRHAALAIQKKEGASPEDQIFYDGKVASARFFAREVLPNVHLTRKHVEQSALDIMNLPEAIF